MTANPWFLCHSLILALLTGLASGRQHSGPGQHFPPSLLPHVMCFLFACDIKGNDRNLPTCRYYVFSLLNNGGSCRESFQVQIGLFQKKSTPTRRMARFLDPPPTRISWITVTPPPTRISKAKDPPSRPDFHYFLRALNLFYRQ